MEEAAPCSAIRGGRQQCTQGDLYAPPHKLVRECVCEFWALVVNPIIGADFFVEFAEDLWKAMARNM